MKLLNHSSVAIRAIRAAALVLLLGAALPLAAQAAIAESPSGKMLTQAGVDSIVDSVGAVWTLGPSDASGFPTKARNGVVDGSAAVLCYSDRSVNARGDLAGGWWKWTDDATLLLKGSWSSVSTTPIGCVVAPAGDTTPPTVPTGLVAVAISSTTQTPEAVLRRRQLPRSPTPALSRARRTTIASAPSTLCPITRDGPIHRSR